MSLANNQVIAESYRIIELIGRGGMGTVYRGLQIRLNREVAIKVLAEDATQDETLVKRFVQEAHVIARLNHPRIVTIFDVLPHINGRHFMIMEFIQGRTVEDYRVASGGTIPPAEACRIGIQVCEALGCAHGAGVIHRDIKPENVMLLESGDVKVMDFGIARLLRDAEVKTQAGRALGTPLYMAPEQIMAREIDGRADLYALGGMLYALTAGGPPFQNTNPILVARMQLTEEPQKPRTRNPKISPELEALILRAMAKKPEARFQHADEMRAALEDELARLRTRGSAQSAATVIDAPRVAFPAADPTPLAAGPAVAGGTAAAPAAKPPTAEFEVPGETMDDLFAEAVAPLAPAAPAPPVAAPAPPPAALQPAPPPARKKGDTADFEVSEGTPPAGITLQVPTFPEAGFATESSADAVASAPAFAPPPFSRVARESIERPGPMSMTSSSPSAPQPPTPPRPGAKGAPGDMTPPPPASLEGSGGGLSLLEASSMRHKRDAAAELAEQRRSDLARFLDRAQLGRLTSWESFLTGFLAPGYIQAHVDLDPAARRRGWLNFATSLALLIPFFPHFLFASYLYRTWYGLRDLFARQGRRFGVVMSDWFHHNFEMVIGATTGLVLGAIVVLWASFSLAPWQRELYRTFFGGWRRGPVEVQTVTVTSTPTPTPATTPTPRPRATLAPPVVTPAEATPTPGIQPDAEYTPAPTPRFAGAGAAEPAATAAPTPVTPISVAGGQERLTREPVPPSKFGDAPDVGPLPDTPTPTPTPAPAAAETPVPTPARPNLASFPSKTMDFLLPETRAYRDEHAFADARFVHFLKAMGDNAKAGYPDANVAMAFLVAELEQYEPGLYQNYLRTRQIRRARDYVQDSRKGGAPDPNAYIEWAAGAGRDVTHTITTEFSFVVIGPGQTPRLRDMLAESIGDPTSDRFHSVATVIFQSTDRRMTPDVVRILEASPRGMGAEALDWLAARGDRTALGPLAALRSPDDADGLNAAIDAAIAEIEKR